MQGHRGRNTKPFRLWQRHDRGDVYFVRYPGGGWQSTGCTDRSAAEAQANKHLGLVELAATLGQPVVRAKDAQGRGALTLGEYAAPFFRWTPGKTPVCPHCRRKLTEGKQIGPEHAQRQRALLVRFLLGDPDAKDKPIPPDSLAGKPLRLIRRGDVSDWRDRVLSKCGADLADKTSAKGKRTAALAMAALSAVFSEAVEREDLESNPARNMTVRVTGTRRGTLNRGELRKMFPTDTGKLGPWGDLQAKTAFLLAATCGLRRNEIRALRWELVDLETGKIHVRESFKGNARRAAPKWDKEREITLPQVTAMHLRALGPGKGMVLHYADGSPMGTQWWEGAWRRAVKALGIDAKGRRLVPHSLRHSAASEARAEGISDELLRGPYGWTSQGVTERYAGHTTETGGQAVASAVDRVLGFRAAKRG